MINWLIKKVVNFAVTKYGFSKAYKRIMAQQNLGKPSEIPIPMEIVNQSADFASRGLLNMFAIQENLNWVMPFWVVRQYDPLSPGYVPSSVLSTNMCYRQWTAIGALGSTREPIIDPAGLLTPLFDEWSVDFWFAKEEKLTVPARLDNSVKQYLVNNLPIVVTTYDDNDTNVTIENFASSEKGIDTIYSSYYIENLESHPVELSLFLSIRPYNPEGISLIEKIDYQPREQSFYVNDSAALVLPQKPDRIFCSNLRTGDCSDEAFSEISNLKSECRSGLANGFAQYKIKLKPGEVYKLISLAPSIKLKRNEHYPARVINHHVRDTRNQVIAGWQVALKDAMELSFPYQKIVNHFNSNKAHLYLFIDGTTITPGPYTYHTMWFRDAAYTVTALDKMNFSEEAGRILQNYPNKQRDDGYFLSQDGEWDSNGQAIWTMMEHFKYTNDQTFLERVYPSIQRGISWIERNRQKDTGLLPPGYSAEHFGPNDTFYWDNFWALAGIRAGAHAAEILQRPTEKKKYLTFFHKYYNDVFTVISAGNPKFPYPLIGSSPSRFEDSAIIGSISALYPLRLVEPRDLRMTGTLRFIRTRFMLNHAFLHRLVHSGLNVYLTAQIAHCYLYRRSSRMIPILEWMLEHITHTGTYPEAIHPRTLSGCMGDGHHGWAAADLLHLIRDIAFFEEGDTLVITPVTFRRWFENGSTIQVKNARSYFGLLNFLIESHADFVRLQMDNHYWRPPKTIEFSTPFAIERTDQTEKVRLVNSRMIRFPSEIKEIVIYRK